MKNISTQKILGIIMAGGKGERLYPLTLERTKPSVPFGGKYRIIDFVLSNFINSEIYSIYVLVQYKSQSLIEHIRTGWKRQGMLNTHFITVVPPQMRREDIKDWYRGTADSVYQNLNLILDFFPSLVAIFGADHIYRMDIRKMIEFHKKKRAEVTLACLPFKPSDTSSFGIVKTSSNLQVKDFEEKPALSEGLSSKKDYLFISMGNYLFNTRVLIQALKEDSTRKTSSHDFGKDIIPNLVKKKKRVYAYDFSRHTLPGIKNHEEKGYWRDVGTIESFYRANMDLLKKKPPLDLSNRQWPIYASSLDCPPALIHNSKIVNSFISEGCIVKGAKIEHSILGRSVIVEERAEIKNSIIMDFTHIKKDVKIRKSIIDRFNTIDTKERIGYNLNKDKQRFFLSSSGIVVIKRARRKVFYW